MSSGKETPRQKMIGMMYLFLTALMALNVSKEVLDSFVLVNDSLANTNENFMAKNDKVYDEFVTRNTENPAKVGPYYNEAIEIKNMADGLYKLIQDQKIAIIVSSDGEETEAVEDRKIIQFLLLCH